jgi:hypothetical protein
MADKTVIVEIQYDTSAAVKNLEQLTSVVEGEKIAQAKLKAELESGAISQKEYSLQVEQSKQQAGQANSERKNTLNLLTAEKGSINELKANIKLLTAERDKLNQNTVAGQKSAQDYTKKINEMKTSLKEAGEESKKTGGFFGGIGDKLSSIPGPIGGIIQGIGGMTKAAIAFIATPFGMVLAAITLAIMAVKAAFTNSEEGQNKWSKAMTVIGALLQGLVNVLAKVGEAIIWCFENPKKAISEFTEMIKQNIINRFNGLLELIPQLGKAIGLLFKGQFSEAGKVAVDAVAKVGLGIDHIVEKTEAAIEKTKEFMAEEMARAAQAQKLADAEAARDEEERADKVEIAKLNLESAKALNEASEKDKLSIEERIALMQKSLEAKRAISKIEMDDAKRDLGIQQQKNALGKQDKTALDEMAAAKAKVYDAEREYYDSTKRAVKQLAAFRIQLEKEQQDAILQTFESQKTSIEKNLESLKEAKGQERNVINLTLGIQLNAYKGDIEASKLTAENKKKLLAEVDKLQNQQALDNKKNAYEVAKAEEEANVKRGKDIMKLSDLKYEDLILWTKREEDKITLQKAQEDERYANQIAENERIKKLAASTTDQKLKAELEAQIMSNEALQVAKAEHDNKMDALDKEALDKKKAIIQEALDGELAALNDVVAATQGMTDQRISIGLAGLAKLSTINYAEIKDAKDAFFQIGAAAQSLTSLINSGHDKQLASLKADKDKELAAVGDNKDAQDAINKTYAAKEQELKKKQFNEDKKKAIIDAAIATALAVIRGLSAGLPMPGILMAALAAVAGGIAIANIAKQQYTPSATYAKGGIIGGNSHAQGGTQFYGSDGSHFEAEKGEAMFVLKKDATAEIAALSMINESHGGRSLTQGASHLAEGGEAMGMPDVGKMVDDAMQRTPIYVRVGDIETGMTETRSVKSAGVV